ncbi:NADPH:quinone oxidoreductase family protein [Nocardioides campestrisoli]|uniref:NADPH:quinone oxidoreductase family protein n=1 Tax=Nocardioides campestrisoli TaxID=2736757 RepID=UPI0015E64407|nr:NADPH:quinone oxidoreductase family protein [Nocardioides campestrisoli]
MSGAARRSTHRAVQVVELKGPEGLRLVELPDPDPGDGVLIEVHHAGVAFPDLLMSRGEYQRKPSLPFSPGVEVAGVVREAPLGCHVRAGDPVAAFVRVGGWAELVVAAPSLVFALPRDLSLRSGAGMPMNYLTAHLALTRRGGLTAGDVLLVHGAAGGLGTALVQAGKALGARVVAVTSTPEKAELARECGADHTVPTDGWLGSVRELLGPGGVDVVADTVGGDALLDSVRCLSREGRVLVLGFASGTIPSIAANRLLLKNVDLRGVAWGSLIEDEPDYPARQWADLMEWHAAGFIRPVDGRCFALSEAGDALRELDSRRGLGKITLALRPADERNS